ncbi:uncharacterized protein LOC112979577 [Dromaius novaehollandiae]|uniref:uncharacterized protein LOC112979577 n=1 Tax=Dromaius novaehollandiae TaxID=8790 RepID=UPI00311EE13F
MLQLHKKNHSSIINRGREICSLLDCPCCPCSSLIQPQKFSSLSGLWRIWGSLKRARPHRRRSAERSALCGPPPPPAQPTRARPAAPRGSQAFLKRPSNDSIHTATAGTPLFFFSAQIFGILKSHVTDDTSPDGAEVTVAAGLNCRMSEESRARVTAPLFLSFESPNPQRSKVNGAFWKLHGASPRSRAAGSLRLLLLLRENAAGSAGIGCEIVTVACDSRLGAGNSGEARDQTAVKRLYSINSAVRSLPEHRGSA